jgi:hypothetical protein
MGRPGRVRIARSLDVLNATAELIEPIEVTEQCRDLGLFVAGRALEECEEVRLSGGRARTNAPALAAPVRG